MKKKITEQERGREKDKKKREKKGSKTMGEGTKKSKRMIE